MCGPREADLGRKDKGIRVVEIIFGTRLRAFVSSLAAVAAFFFAGPALANSSATADIAAPLRAAQASKPCGYKPPNHAATSQQTMQLQASKPCGYKPANRAATSRTYHWSIYAVVY